MTKTIISERFRSVFVASLASMSISYILILTDNTVAGRLIGDEAVAAMTLITPIVTFIIFLSYMVADGLAMMFAYAKGKNDRTKANELFSMGITVSVVTGALVTVILILFQDKILSMWEISPNLMNHAKDYYHGLMFIALPCVLNIYFYTIYVAEGEENICVKASGAMFIVNIILDIVLGYFFGVIGIGVATTIGNLVSFLYHVPYLFSKDCQLQFISYWDGREMWQGIFYSWYHSMDTLYLALLPIIFSEFVIFKFGEQYLIIVTIIINMFTLLITIYTGIVDCLQPMVCQYHAENAQHSVQKTMSLAIKATLIVTIILIVFSFAFAELLPWMFGVGRGEQTYFESIFAVRVFMPFTLFLGVTLMISNYYIYIERLNLGAVIKTLLLLILPSVGLVTGFLGLRFLWAGVGFSFIVTLFFNWLITRNKFGLLLIDKREMARQFSFDISNAPENLSTLITELKKYFATVDIDDKQKIFLTQAVEKIFNVYAARKDNFQMEVSVLPAADTTTLIFRENGAPENPLNSLGRFFDDVREKNYLISGDENKFVVVV